MHHSPCFGPHFAIIKATFAGPELFFLDFRFAVPCLPTGFWRPNQCFKLHY